jgi:hypothetical protein
VSVLARLRPAVAVLVTATAGWLGVLSTAGAASAAPCPGREGVTVVVEYGALGGGTGQFCVPEGGGRTADRLLKDTGHELTYVQRFPGFVCRIEGLPADDPCVNTPPPDAYWGLWWSDGRSGEWSYSSLGAGSLSIPAGGYVAMVWDGSSGDVRPQSGAPAHPTPTATPTPTRKPSPSQAPTQPPTPVPTPTVEPTATAAGPVTEPTPRPSRTKKPQSSATPSPSEKTTAPDPTTATSAEEQNDQQTGAAGPIDDPVDPAAAADDGGLPAWVAPVVVAVLLGTAGGIAVARRRQQP